MSNYSQPEKVEVIKSLLKDEGRVMLCLDATLPEVDVPRRFSTDDGLRLILNREMPQSIDFSFLSVESELAFGGISHYCRIPFTAIWGAYNPDSGHGRFWPESMPAAIRVGYEMVDANQDGQQELPESAQPPKPTGGKVELKVLSGGGNRADSGKAKKKKKQKKKNHLRLVE